MMAAFDDEGLLHVVRQRVDDYMVVGLPARIEVHALYRAGVVSERSLDRPLVSHHRSPDGSAVLEVGQDGSLEVRSADGQQPRTVRSKGIHSAAW